MPARYVPQETKEFITPFGPLIGYYQMPEAFHRELNNRISSDLRDHGGNLVGKVREEKLFDEPLKELAAQYLGPLLIEYHARALTRGGFGGYNHRTKRYGLDIVDAWYVRQYENEYNPLHIHMNCALSCVGYLSLPDGIEEEWEQDQKAGHPTHGHLQFAHGTDTQYSVSNFTVRPKVGDFWIFPSSMFHCVYPYKTPGERRSFSMNCMISEENIG
ncbi:MAG: hypothetical protein HRU11_01055 [Parvularculaceae bacterium]|nr:hypothetical protein [Parvularculaceae bacterium]